MDQSFSVAGLWLGPAAGPRSAQPGRQIHRPTNLAKASTPPASPPTSERLPNSYEWAHPTFTVSLVLAPPPKQPPLSWLARHHHLHTTHSVITSSSSLQYTRLVIHRSMERKLLWTVFAQLVSPAWSLHNMRIHSPLSPLPSRRRRKSVSGLSIDFTYLNPLGFACITVSLL